MSVIFVYYRNCYFVVTCWLYEVGALGVFAYGKQWSRINQRMRYNQIKINFSSFMPLIRHVKHQTKPPLQTTLIKDTIYSLNGSSRNSVNGNLVSLCLLNHSGV